MNFVHECVKRLRRDPRTSTLLEKFGVDPKRYWLLMDLFAKLSERSEMRDQLGRNGIALKVGAILYFFIAAFVGLLLLLAQIPASLYFFVFMGVTGFLLVSILISEAGNSLLNPMEAMVLAHQPINGATYIAAKLSHLGMILLVLVTAIDLLPAVGGLVLKGAAWYYPALHLAGAFAVGIAAALLCCALFGLMLRIVPVQRLKAAGQIAGMLPFLVIMLGQPIVRRLARVTHLISGGRWTQLPPAIRWSFEVAAGCAIVGALILGIRSLSADYLIRVSNLTRGGASAGSRARRSPLGSIVRCFFGGQTAAAGFAFVSRMILRDWQFRRLMLSTLVYPLISLASVFSRGWPTDPFFRRFSSVHLLPHVLGFLLFFSCNALKFGNDYKGVWIFSSIPSRAFDGFARGVHALLWIDFILIPHAIAFPLLAWRWGIPHAGLFIAYSVAAASTYLALEVRLIEYIPFCKQMDGSGQMTLLPLMIGGGIAAAIVVGVQYFLIFRSSQVVAAATLALAIAAYFATRASLNTFAVSMRYHLGLISGETGAFYKEIWN